MTNVIVSNFKGLSDPAFLAQVERIVTGMTGNTAFPEPWPSTVPTLAQIQSDLTAFQAALIGTKAGDRTRIEERRNARSKLQGDLGMLGFSVQTTAQGNTTLLATTGFPLRKQAVRPQVPMTPEAPQVKRLVRGPVSGSIVVTAIRLPAAVSYDVQVTAADPTVESNWTDGGSFKNVRQMQVRGLTPMKTYSVRMRALGAGGFGGWSAVQQVAVV